MAPTPYQPLNLTPGGRDQCPGEAAMTYARFLAVALALGLPAAPAAAGPAKPTPAAATNAPGRLPCPMPVSLPLLSRSGFRPRRPPPDRRSPRSRPARANLR